MMKGSTLISLLLAVAIVSGVILLTRPAEQEQLGAPVASSHTSLLPFTDSTYYLGTTTPTLKAWLSVITDEVCLASDCRTSWPAGGSGGTGTVSTSTNETAGFLSYWTTNSGTPARLGQVATTTVSCSGSTTCTTFTAIGGSPITISSTGGGTSAFEIATTSDIAVPQLAYFTKTSGRTTLGSVATTTLGGGSTGLTFSNNPVILGSSASALSGTLVVGNGGTGTTTWMNGAVTFYDSVLGTLSQGASQAALFFDKTNSRLGIGTTTPQLGLTIFSNTEPQISLSQGSGLAQWVLRNAGENLYLATTTVAGTATTSTSALEIAGTGFGTTTLRGLNINGQATSTSNVGYNITSGCFAINGTCVGGSGGGGSPGGTGTELQYRAGASTFGAVSSAYDSSGSGRLGIGTTTMRLPVLTIASTTGPQLGLSYGAGVMQWIVRNNNGRFSIASTTVDGTAEAATPQFSINGTTGNVGIRSTSPIGALEVRPATDGPDVLNIARVDGSRSFSLGTFPGDPSYVGFWGGAATPGATNYALLTDGASETVFNVPGAGSAMYFRVNNSTVFSARQTEVGIGTGSTNVANTLTVAGNGSFGTSLASVSAPTSGLLVEGETRIGTTTQGLTSRLTSSHGTAPQLVLSNGAGIAQWAFRNAGGNLYLATTTVAGTATTSPSAISILGSSGNVGIGTTTPEFKLAVEFFGDGNMFQLYDTDGNCLQNPEAGGITTTCTSDARLKKNIRNAAPTLDWVNRFIVRDYELKSTNDTVTGVIAQEIQNTHPELYEEIQGGLFVKEPSVWKVIKAIQELSSKNDTQDDRLAAIEARLEEVEKELAVYKNMCLLK